MKYWQMLQSEKCFAKWKEPDQRINILLCYLYKMFIKNRKTTKCYLGLRGVEMWGYDKNDENILSLYSSDDYTSLNIRNNHWTVYSGKNFLACEVYLKKKSHSK